MQKVITVNLNGNAYQVEEPGYEALRAYLESAERGLASDPDRAEIVADLEQAIADKCARVLGAHKNVVTKAEIDQIVAEMGPVEGAGPAPRPRAEQGPAPAPQPEARGGEAPHDPRATQHKRLYVIYDGAWFGGVCNGIAAYLDVDPTVVRVAFVAVTLLTGGIGLFVYLALMFILPEAKTPEEHAAAHGLPFNAQELVRRAKAKYSEFAEHESWKREWKKQRRLWRQQRKEWRAQWRRGLTGVQPWQPGAPPPDYGTRVFAGAMIPLLVLLSVVLLVLFAAAGLSLVVTGKILSWSLPTDVPVWSALLVLAVLYFFLSWPLHAARRATRYASGHVGDHATGLESVVTLVVAVFAFWYLYKHVPMVHDFVQDLQVAMRSLVHSLRELD
jgi:phage shock protein PspC (stress-responsive transcriptional regulator)